MLGATIAAVVALIITSNVERGPTHDFRLVPVGSATSSELLSDAGALVRRLHSLGYADAQSQVAGSEIVLDLYGSEQQVTDELRGVIAEARFEVRPVQCAVPPYDPAAGAASTRLHPNAGPDRCGAAVRVVVSGSPGESSYWCTGQPDRCRTRPSPACPTLRVHLTCSPRRRLSRRYRHRLRRWALVLGPVDVDNSDVASAGAEKGSSGWFVEITLTTAGGKDLDSLAKKQFHAYLAICVDGTVISAPIVEPTSVSFVPLGGQLQWPPASPRTKRSTWRTTSLRRLRYR